VPGFLILSTLSPRALPFSAPSPLPAFTPPAQPRVLQRGVGSQPTIPREAARHGTRALFAPIPGESGGGRRSCLCRRLDSKAAGFGGAFCRCCYSLCRGHELPGLVQAEVEERRVVVGAAGGVGAAVVGPGDHDDDHGVGGEHEPVGRLRRGAAGEQVGGVGRLVAVAAEHLVAVRGAGPRPAAGVRLRGAPGRHRRLRPRAEARRGRLRQRLQGLRPRGRRQGGPHPRRRQEAQPAQPAGAYVLCLLDCSLSSCCHLSCLISQGVRMPSATL
jgi:hypothetical protein